MNQNHIRPAAGAHVVTSPNAVYECCGHTLLIPDIRAHATELAIRADLPLEQQSLPANPATPGSPQKHLLTAVSSSNVESLCMRVRTSEPGTGRRGPPAPLALGCTAEWGRRRLCLAVRYANL